MRRREVMAVLGGVSAAWPHAALAQQPAFPVIGFLNSASPAAFAPYLHAFHEGLREEGFVEGRNVRIEYRWAEGQYARLPTLASELLVLGVDVIVAVGGEPSGLAAKNATSRIPIVIGAGRDAVAVGLVSNLGRPSGNVTGVSHLAAELEGKRFEILRDLHPAAQRFALLVNPDHTASAERQAAAIRQAAKVVDGSSILIVAARSEDAFAPVFETLVRERIDGLVVGSDPFFNSRRDRLVALAAEHRVPAIYEWREFVLAGGLASYGASLTNAYRQFGRYAGRILNGAKPADLPVLQPTHFELVINLKAARALGLRVADPILARADEVIE